MQLLDWIRENGLTYAAAAERLGFKDPTTSRRYALGLQIPRPEMMRRIAEATGGAVQANDFYPEKAENATPEAEPIKPCPDPDDILWWKGGR